jgi:hypothetical protein
MIDKKLVNGKRFRFDLEQSNVTYINLSSIFLKMTYGEKEDKFKEENDARLHKEIFDCRNNGTLC